MEKRSEKKAEAPAYTASLHPDKRTFVWGGLDNMLHVCNYETGDQLEEYKGHFGPVHCVRYSPDGEVRSMRPMIRGKSSLRDAPCSPRRSTPLDRRMAQFGCGRLELELTMGCGGLLNRQNLIRSDASKVTVFPFVALSQHLKN